ncbi:MAG: cation:proton antiporter [Nitrospirales bacterium]|nr:MAG: cation:proton antiporter [Nitrospirales bacterium]
MSRHFPALLFLLPLFAAISMPMACLKHREWSHPIAIGVLSVMIVLSLLNLQQVLENGAIHYAFSGWTAPLGIEWVADPLASIILVALSFLGFVALIFAGPTAPKDLGGRIVHFYTLILLLISALTGIVFAGDLFNLFVFLEVAALASYALVGVAGGRALFAAFRYLILGTLGASLYLLGVSYFYAASGTLNMADMAEKLPHLLTSRAVLGGLLFMFIGLGIKMALVPFHAWLPDAYACAPESVSPILAALVTKVALLGWVRVLFWVLGAKAVIQDIPVLLMVEILGSLAAIIGAVLAFSQHEIKRMFAYGGISHIGIILIGVSQGNQTGFAGGIFYLLNDAVMQAALFFFVGIAICQYGIRHIQDLGRIGKQAPWLIGALVIIAMGMVGLPPTGGFFGKWYIILGALEANNYVAVGAVLLSTLLTLAYFVKIFDHLFRTSSTASNAEVGDSPVALKFSLLITSAAIVILGLWSDPIVGLILNQALPPGL